MLTAIALSLVFHQTMLAPERSFTTITGKKLALQDFHGKPVLVSFWATDCPGCIKEIPELIELYQRYHKRGLEIIAISMYYDPPSHVVGMADARQLPYPVVLDLRAEHAKAFGDVALTPSTFLISPDGEIALKYIGAFDFAALKNQIENFLAG